MEKITDRLYTWASDMEAGTLIQAGKASRLPIIEGHVALMPDAHVGIGATVGSVIPTKNAVIPSAVGVDIGCGMIAAETNLTASQLPDSLDQLLPQVERAVPAGVGRGHDKVGAGASRWYAANNPRSTLTDKQIKTALEQFGTLGSGNHFAEVCLDERDIVWLVLHSGSRGIGNQLAQGHISRARNLAKELELRLEDPDLAYFMEGTPEFEAYIRDMLWAQDYAKGNRDEMMKAFIDTFFAYIEDVPAGVDPTVGSVVRTINCHHNFTQRETHGDKDLWITRKGAIKADVGDLGVIPGSMGTRSYIVEGLGNPLSWNSCSHGAGRRHSRGAAKRLFSEADLAEQMQGKVWLADRAKSLVDEIPSAYKDIDQVMADQKDLVKVHHTLHQILNYKGA